MICNELKIIKIKPFFVFILLFLETFIYAQNNLKVVDASAGPGEKSVVLINLANADEIVGVEFTLTVPQGLRVSEKDSKIIESRKDDHAVYVNIEKNNPTNYHFIILSMTSKPFKGNDGTLLQIPIEIPLDYASGQIHNLNLSGVVLSSKNAADIGSNHVNGKLTIAPAQFPDLTVSGITTTESTISPEGKISVSWGIDNIGDRIASGGWIEQISIVSDQTGLEYNLGMVSYNEDLDKKKSISRNATFNLPKVLGIDGSVKVKINVIANTAVKEPEWFKTNNRVTAASNIVLEKKLYLVLDKKTIDEHSTEVIRAVLTQSGDRSADKTYGLTASLTSQLQFDANVKILKDQSSVVFYIRPIDNMINDGNRTVNLSISGNQYAAVSENIEIIDNEFSTITLAPTKTTAVDGETITVNLSTDFAKTKDTKFTITADQSSRWMVPTEVMLPSGSTTASFTITVKNNGVPEPTVAGKLIVRAEGFQAGNTEIILKSSNLPAFELEVTPETISKGDGIYATYAIIKRLDKSDISTRIRLSANIGNTLILPGNIEFAAGVNQAKVNIGAINNGLVDGAKMVSISADVFISSCNCTVPAGTGGSLLSKNITILDSNGPALIVKANPSTVKAGEENATKITIARNTVDTSTAILVRLSSDAPSVVNIPETVTIPAGSESIEVNISTKIDPSKTGDQILRVQGEADDYTAGFAWIIVTDQNKPDAVITKISSVNQSVGKENIDVTAKIQNQGFATLLKGVKVDYYLSKDQSVNGTTLLSSTVLDVDIEAGKSIDFIKKIQLPEISGDYFLGVVLNSDQKTNELSYWNNQYFTAIKLMAAYSVTASIAKTMYKSGENVTITGAAKMLNNSPAIDKDVEITIKSGNYVRSFLTKTNQSGNFAYDFKPLEAESGHYTLSTGYPGTVNAVQAEFDIIGFEWINRALPYLKWDVVEHTPFNGEFILKNNSKTPLNSIKIEIPSDAGFAIQTDPLTLAAGMEGVLKYTILANKVSELDKYYPINFTISSAEGAKLNGLVYYHSQAQSAKLSVNPVSINTTMVKGSSRFYEFTITNNGAITAENVKVELPKLDWMKLKNASVIDQIPANKSVNVILELTPTDKQQVNIPLSGNLAVLASNADGIRVPFKIETVSDNKGTLVIDAVDDYTYNTVEAPHLKGAKVIVRHPFSGQIIAEGLTDVNGLFTVENIPEGSYVLSVTADKHSNYKANILVDPGKVNKQNVYLSYQAISYEWVVKPTEIADQYETELVVKYETNVPVPVVVLEMDKKVQEVAPGSSYIMMATLTNKGLITAEDVYLQFPTDSEYRFTALIDKINILAKQSVQIPIKVERLSGTSNKKTSGGSCDAFVLAWYTYECVNKHWVAVPQSFSFSRQCTSSRPVDIPVASRPSDNYCRNCFYGPDFGVSSESWGIDFSYDAGVNCDPCITALGSGLIGCYPPAAAVICAISVITSPAWEDIPGIVLGCIGKRIPSCIRSLGNSIITCLRSKVSGKKASTNLFEGILEDFTKINAADDAFAKKKELLFDSKIMDSENFADFVKEAASNLDKKQIFTQTDIAAMKSRFALTDITAGDIDNFSTKWNQSVHAWNGGVTSPSVQYPNIISKDSLDLYTLRAKELLDHVKSRGFSSAFEMYEKDRSDLQEYVDRASSNSACATVTVKFSQKMTMTREAFEGTLTMNNGTENSIIKNINLDLVVTDELGNDMTHLFQINKDAFLSGTGLVNPQSSDSGTVIFIPTKEAAPTVAKSYSFGGTLSYLDPNTGKITTIKLYPVTLEVNPSPDLVMHYFMQRDILGDDPLTDKVEPIVPAEMALLIKNEGYGIAKNVQVESVQPKIVENKKGLMVDFEIVGSNFNNEPKQLGLLNVDFGNIEPQKAALGQWWFTSTLLGHFVEYDLKVKHLSSYGNKNLSLIKASYVHELIKSVKAYGPREDNIGDFLVNDRVDINDVPDAVYYSNGESDEVYSVKTGTVSNLISPGKLTSILTMDSSKTGWNYGNITDPGSDKYKLERVIRQSDNLELPIENFWQTFVTLRDGAAPKYENNLHFLDKISGLEKYTLYYTAINTNIPRVESFGVIPSTTTKAIESVQVNFNKAIDPNTFTSQNIKLIYQGTTIPFDNSLIGKVNDSTYVFNIKTLSAASGYYELTVQCAGIKDLEGNEGADGKVVSWIQIIGELGIVQFKTNQVQAQSLNSIEILFNKSVKPIQFTKDKLTLNGQSVENISIVTDDNLKYTIVGLNEYNKENGAYELAVDLPSIKAEDNTTGLVVQIQKWKVDIQLPEIEIFTPQYQGAVNSQNVTDILLKLNKPVTAMDKNWITLYKGSVNLNVNLTVTKQDDLQYLISGLGEYTQIEGDYKIVIDQSNLKDLSGNLGIGSVSTMWEVKFGKPSTPQNMRITPDRGISATDNVTSGNDLSIALTTTGNKQAVELYVVTPTGKTLITKQTQETAKEILIPIKGYFGKNTFEAILYDEFGNASDPANVEAYIDIVDLNCTVVPLSINNDCSETDALKVQFDDEIIASAFTKNDVIIKSGGIVVPNTIITFKKVSDKEFEIANLEQLTGSHSIEVDLTKLNKKLSGLQGKGLVSTTVQPFNKNTAVIKGDLIINEENSIVTYTATNFMRGYNWHVTGGEIVEQINNTITIKWIEKGEQTITLNYTTPALCSKTTSLEVKVDASLSIDNNLMPDKTGLVITPVPNNGTFTMTLSGDEGIFNLRIYDVNGKAVYKHDKFSIRDNTRREIQTPIEASGMYFLVLQKADKSYKTKFLVK
jgi:hypothetical protein